MKKIAILVAVVMLIAGTASAQTMPDDFGPVIPLGSPQVFDSLFDVFNAVDATSVENRYSRGIFTSLVDDYIDVNGFDPEVGTFVFLGGFPDDVPDSAGNNPLGANVLNFGAAHTFDFGYIGLYYRGGLVNAGGDKALLYANPGGATPPTGVVDTIVKYSDTTWQNRFAVLFGMDSIGAVRLDVISENDRYERASVEGTKAIEYNGRESTYSADNPTRFALTWGGLEIAGLNPKVTIGIAFPTSYKVTEADQFGTTVVTDEYSWSQGFGFGLQAGVGHESGLWGDIALTTVGGTSSESLVHTSATTSTKSTYDSNGTFRFGLRVGYYKAFEFEKFAFGLQPVLRLATQSSDSSYKQVNGSVTVERENAKDGRFELDTNLNLGLRYNFNEKFALYTGAELRIFEWIVASVKGGKLETGAGAYDSRAEQSAWEFNGFRWNTPTALQLGLTFAPNENIVVGFGLETLQGKLLNIDLAEMEVSTGTWFNDSGAGNTGDMANNLLRNLTFNLTVSVKIPSGEKSE